MRQRLWHIFLALLISACSDKVEIDDSQADTFNKLYGNAGNDRGVEIKELMDGSFLILGTIETAEQSTEIVLIKTDRFGNELWKDKFFGRGAEDIAGGMDIKENGNIIIAGTSFKSIEFASPENNRDIVVYEVDQNGDLVEEWLFDYGDNEEANCIAYDTDSLGGFMVCGNSDAERSNAISDFTPNAKFSKDLLAIRYYLNGSVPDTNIFQAGYNLDDNINSVIFDKATNNFLAAGFINLQGTQQAQFLRLSNKINTVQPWESRSTLALQGPAVISKINRVNNGGYAIIGTYTTSNDRLFLIEIGSDLEFIDKDKVTFDIQKSGAVRGYSFAYNEGTNSFIVSGATNVSQGGGFDHYIASVKRSGEINWEETYGGSGDEEAFAIAPTSDGGYIITGYTGFEGNSLINTIKVDNKGILNP